MCKDKASIPTIWPISEASYIPLVCAHHGVVDEWTQEVGRSDGVILCKTSTPYKYGKLFSQAFFTGSYTMQIKLYT